MTSSLKASDICDALELHFPQDRYIHVREAPLDPSCQGRKIDVAIIGCWHSLKFEIDAIEVKVSYSDWQKEVRRTEWTLHDEYGVRAFKREPKPYETWQWRRGGWHGPELVRRAVVTDTSKSLQWRQHSHRFWIACPAELAKRIEPELPDGWGLIAVDETGCRRVVKAKTNAEMAGKGLGWHASVGLLRTASGCGANALLRAEQRGRRTGYTEGRSAGQRDRLTGMVVAQ